MDRVTLSFEAEKQIAMRHGSAAVSVKRQEIDQFVTLPYSKTLRQLDL
jgi:hypothetical protein